MTITPNLALPYIDAAQAQKHVTHNEAIRGLDALVQTAIVTRTLSAPPAAPADGACYLLAAAGTGLWAGQAAGAVAAWQDASWVFYAPKTGWLVWIVDEAASVTWTGAAWQIPSPPQLGVNATADAANKLSVNSSAVLFNNIGNGIQLKLNKHAVTDTASVLYQDNFSGRAETGLTGDDSYHFKVSPDGATWKEALKIDATSALGTVFGDPAAALGIATKQYVDAHTGLTPPGGGSGQLQFNNAGAFGGFTASGDAAINTSTGAVTITANVVTNAKAAQMPANTLKGNNTAVSANAADMTTAQTKALLAISTADVSGLGALATAATVNLTTQATGTLQAAQEPAHTGDVTNAAGSLALAIAANAVTNAKAAQMAANTLKGNNTAAAANAADLTTAQTKALLAISTADVSGLGALATAATVNLTTQATGTLQAAQEPAHTGDVTNAVGSLALAIAANAVTNAKAAQMPANIFKGNNTAAAANAADLTTAQAKALLAISTADITGLGVLATASTVNLSTQATGTTQAAQEPGHTGDVTNAAGSLALAIANNVVTNAKLAQMPANTLKGNKTAAVANAVDITPSQALDVIGSTRGALPFRGASGWGVLAPGAAGQALTSNGAGADPSYLPVRPQLTAARTYFVATTGSDANTGLAVGTPFLTIQKAVDTVASLDINGQTIIIQVADGTYTGAVSLKNAVGFIGLGSLQLVGNVTTPANCILNVPAGCITASSLACAWDVSGFRLASTAGNALTVNGSVVRIATIDFGACPAGNHMSLSQAGKILSLGNYSMSGAALAHFNAIGQSFVDVSGRTITIAGTPAITTFVIANYLSLVWIFGCTFSGTATGQRYSAGTNGIIYVNGAATTYLPGSTAGATATGGQYV